ncbi:MULTISPECIES: RHS repeat-associated core domain-containing protein [Pseudidiomarina]|uniref:RHS repeat-associated protein n=2 Tax=Pseudidiomarina TaxID=2800384 RepID=A0A368UNW3_9GAMM|nr:MULTISPECIES: RHS repeat-associated core domain-containing protein [Pseudidiomarina]PWW07916.1 RHS repeat-associated protein [Pseudidiomarina maritima]RBP86922.1 RHS repeat-associated protein [Pseudidiomarina tainanensis]RCW29084.1 RHS repeat-associated protein [Pseudidiomarina tainanensis]
MIDGTLMEPGARPRLKNFADYAGISNIGITRRGFTDHLHLDDVELIHMNGRVYDYNLALFLSVDPVIQSPGNSQSLNPYSYLMNNPLAGTDPTGYSGCGVSQMADSMCPHMTALENATTDTSSKPRQNDSASNTVGNGASDKVARINGSGETSDLALPTEAGTSGRNTSDIEKELGGSTFKTTEDGWTLNWSENVTREDKSDLIGESQDSFYVGLVDELTTQVQVLKNGKVDPNDTNDNFLIQGLNNSAYRKYTATSDVYENYT